MKIISYLLTGLTAFYPLHPAIGAGISVAGNQTQVIQQGQVPVINIATPNAAGVSHNQYQDFNVAPTGAVLNNAVSSVTSQLAGQMSANGNLNGKSADLIINEVVSGNVSSLQGKLEVAGQKANILIANPNGITCDGCGFINSPSVTLSTGKPVFDKQGALEALAVKKGAVTIGDKGWDAKAQDYVDILSQATVLNGKIQAKNLSLTQGTNRIDLKQGTITPIKGDSPAPSLAVDSAALGGMYANKIRLVATETGVGVNLVNIVTDQSAITMTVKGEITVNNANAKTDINVSSQAFITPKPTATVKAGGDITLATDRLKNSGKITAGQDMRLFTARLTNMGQQAVIQAHNHLWIQKDATGNYNTSVYNHAATLKTNTGDLIVRTKMLSLVNGRDRQVSDPISTLSAGRHAYVNASNLNNEQGQLSAGNNMILSGIYLNFKEDISALPGARGGIHAGGNLVADFSKGVKLLAETPHQGDHKHVAVSGKNVVLKGQYIRNSIYATAKDNLSIIAEDDLETSHGKLEAGNDLSVMVVRDIDAYQTELRGKNVSLVSREGHIQMGTLDKSRYFNTDGGRLVPSITATNTLSLSSGRNISLLDTLVNKTNHVSLHAGQNIKIGQTPEAYQIGSALQNANALKSGLINQKYTLLNKLEAAEEISLVAGNDLILRGSQLNAGKHLILHAGHDIDMHGKASPPVPAPLFALSRLSEAGTRVTSGDDLSIYAGRDIVAQASTLSSQKGNVMVNAGRDMMLSAQQYSPVNDAQKKSVYATTHIKSAKKLNLSIGDKFSAYASDLTSNGHLFLTSNGNMTFNALQEYQNEGNTEKTTQHITQLNSGGNLTVLSNGSILFQATKLVAKGAMDIAAKGGFLFAQAMEETYRWEETKKSCNRFLGIKSCRVFGSETQTRQKSNATNKVTEFTADGNITLMARDDITLEATKVNTQKNAKLTSQKGKINFKAVNNTAFEQTITDSKGFFITHQDKGFAENKWVLPSLHLGGKLVLEAANGLSADVKVKEGQSFEQAVAVLSHTKGYEWLNEIKNNKNVNWRVVKEAYSQWDKKSEHLNPVVSAVITIAVAAATYGTAAAANIGGLVSSAVTSAGGFPTTAAILSASAQSGFSALAAQAAVALVENKGNLSKTLSALGKSDNVKSLVTSMAMAGAFQGFDMALYGKATDPAIVRLPQLSHGDWSQAAQRVAGQSVISATLGTAIQGGSFTDNFKAALLSQVSGQVHTEGANFIGTQGEILGYPGKALSHAVLSGLTAEISRGNVKGAVVGGLAAELAAISLGNNLINAEQWQKKSEAQAQLARAFGGIAGAVFTGQPGGVYSGATAAENSFRYNYLSHHQQALMEKELTATSNDFKKALISLKWGYTSLDQDVSLGAGMVAGAPVGLYETIDGLANLASNPKETYTAIKAVLQSDDTLGIISDAVKQSYIVRLERMEAEYQKAGTAGAFNAGIEGGKIIFDIASTLAGVAGIAKGGAILIDKVVAKVAAGKVESVAASVYNQQLIKNAEKISTAKPGQQTAVPRDLNEQTFWKSVQSKPLQGKELPGLNNDPSFPTSAGFQKMEAKHKLPDGQTITIHYQYNSTTGKAYDMKITTPQRVQQDPKQVVDTIKDKVK
ncbi:DUF637 domain-containing protein [Arsenophonus nasoniae]|nr:DUF637 domain-containing protein [Arsenophonus nasoniae]